MPYPVPAVPEWDMFNVTELQDMQKWSDFEKAAHMLDIWAAIFTLWFPIGTTVCVLRSELDRIESHNANTPTRGVVISILLQLWNVIVLSDYWSSLHRTNIYNVIFIVVLCYSFFQHTPFHQLTVGFRKRFSFHLWYNCSFSFQEFGCKRGMIRTIYV